MTVVLDASALLAYLHDEQGAARVATAMQDDDAVISAVNLGEVTSKLTEAAFKTGDVQARRDVRDLLLAQESGEPLGGVYRVEPFTGADAVAVGILRADTMHLGLSLGDRACLALARRLRAPAMTSDQAWAKLPPGLATVQLIRAASR